MLQMLNKILINRYANPVKQYTTDEIIWETQVKYYYYIVRNKFIYCMQHKLLHRQAILTFKAYLNRYIYLNKYKNIKFKNDAHEIYTKLKDTHIRKEKMLKLNKFLDKFISQS